MSNDTIVWLSIMGFVFVIIRVYQLIARDTDEWPIDE